MISRQVGRVGRLPVEGGDDDRHGHHELAEAAPQPRLQAHSPLRHRLGVSRQEERKFLVRQAALPHWLHYLWKELNCARLNAQETA